MHSLDYYGTPDIARRAVFPAYFQFAPVFPANFQVSIGTWLVLTAKKR